MKPRPTDASRFLPALLAAVFCGGLAVTAAKAAAPHIAPSSPLLQHVLFGFGENAKPATPPIAPIYEVHDDATFQALTKPFGMTPFGKAELEYEITLPKDWTEEEVPQTLTDAQTIIGDVARYSSPMIGTQDLHVIVQVVKLEHEISAQNWLKNYILVSGYSQQGDIVVNSGKSASAEYITAGSAGTLGNTSVASTSTVETTTVRITGAYAILATFKTPLSLENYVKFIQKKSIDSFRILYPKDDPVEEQKTFTLVDSIKFNYPVSWSQVGTDMRDMNRLSVHLQAQSASNTIGGFVRILAIRRSRSTNFKAEIETQQKYFQDTMKIKFIKLLSSGKSPAYNRFIFNRYEVYETQPLTGNGISQEIHVAVLGDKDWYIFAYLFTPKEVNSLYDWARNTQSFQEILKSVK